MPRSGTSAKGTDINRNWPYKWEVSGGASTSPSAEDYKGQAAGDTPEVKVLKAFTDKLAAGKGIKLYIDFHSYGQYILLPYGYSCSKKATNDAKQESLAGGLQSAIAKPNGKKFTYGPICSTLYAATGGSTDVSEPPRSPFAPLQTKVATDPSNTVHDRRRRNHLRMGYRAQGQFLRSACKPDPAKR